MFPFDVFAQSVLAASDVLAIRAFEAFVFPKADRSMRAGISAVGGGGSDLVDYDVLAFSSAIAVYLYISAHPLQKSQMPAAARLWEMGRKHGV